MAAYDSQAKLFKALNHPARLAILDVLREGEHCVCHMETALGYRQAYISQHLMVLRDAGLVRDRRDGWNIYYRVTKPEVFAVIDAAQNINGAQKAHKPHADRLDHCPCPHCNPQAEPVVC
ncbi:MAG: metalloregulator ArsR/SmtB family transcription factor [Chloroflexota bacterium]